jgi:hypothetical protein
MARQRTLHYAWIVAGVTFLTLLVAAGLRATPGVLIVPLETEFGRSRAGCGHAISGCSPGASSSAALRPMA